LARLLSKQEGGTMYAIKHASLPGAGATILPAMPGKPLPVARDGERSERGESLQA